MFHGKAALVLGIVSMLCAHIEATSCKPNGQKCGLRAECHHHDCHCPTANPQGKNPDFRCYPDNVHYAEIVNDPSVVSYFGESIQLPLPCPFRFTHFITYKSYYDDYINFIFESEVIVDVLMAKKDGKFYVKGFILHYYHYSHYVDHNFDITVTSEVENGVYKYIEHNHAANSTHITTDPHFLFDSFSDFGYKIEFTGYDTVLKADAIYTPGISVIIEQANDRAIYWMYYDTDIALAPLKTDGSYFKDINWKEGLSTKEHALLFRAMQQYNSSLRHFHPNPPAQCTTAAELLENCDLPDLKEALDNCYWLLTEPLLIRCVDETNNGSQIMYIFNECISSWCSGEPTDCFKAIDSVKDKKCHERDDVISRPEIPGFLKGCNCPPEYRPKDC